MQSNSLTVVIHAKRYRTLLCAQAVIVALSLPLGLSEWNGPESYLYGMIHFLWIVIMCIHGAIEYANVSQGLLALTLLIPFTHALMAMMSYIRALLLSPMTIIRLGLIGGVCGTLMMGLLSGYYGNFLGNAPNNVNDNTTVWMCIYLLSPLTLMFSLGPAPSSLTEEGGHSV